MARSKSKIAIMLFTVFLAALFIAGSIANAHAQSFGDDWIEDSKLHVKVEFNNRNIKSATEENPIPIPRDSPVPIFLSINVTNDVALNITGVVTFYYQNYPVLPITIQQEINGSYASYAIINPDQGAVVDDEFPLSAALSLQNATGIDLDLITGIYEVGIDFVYTEVGGSVTPTTLHWQSYFLLPVENPTDAIFTVFGAVTAVSTVSAVSTGAFNIKALFDGIQTAHKARSIQKKTGEIRSLPNLLVIGALPALFSMLSGLVKLSKKQQAIVQSHGDDSVSEYILRQRLREAAPEAWPVDKCPQCKRNWDKKTNTCKKCKINEEQGREAYSEYLISKSEKALKVIGKKNSISIKNLAKKIKTNEYNAGVIAAAMVDTDVTEIQKVATPFKSFVLNIGGLIFLVLTWQQLLGGASSEFQTTLTLVGAGLSLAVIIALYVARKTQIQKLTDRVDAGGKMMPTESERKEGSAVDSTRKEPLVEDDEPPEVAPTYEEPEESTLGEGPVDEEDSSDVLSPDENLDSYTWEDEEDSDSLSPEELDKERK